MSNRLYAVFVMAIGGLGCAASALAAQPSVVVIWNEAALEEVRRGRMEPPVAARALAIAHTCI